MFQKDWLQRQLEMLSALIAQLLKLRQDGDEQAALQLIDDTYRELFGLEPRLVGLTPDEFLIDKVRSGNRIDGHRALTLATLLREDAAGQARGGNEAEHQQRLLKSLAVFLECSKDGTLPPHYSEVYDVQAVLDDLNDAELSPTLKYNLFQFYEDTGRYASAEDMLFELIDSSDAPQTLIAEGVAFYEWLLTQDDADLVAGNLPRREVEESLARLREWAPN